jgi:septal ring factor EnvC (AmiA/AmiB activator)
MLKNNNSNIILCVVAALLVYLIFTTNGIKTDIKGYRNLIENIQTKIDSAQVVNREIDTKIDSVTHKVVTITNEIHQINKTITIVKKQTDEKANNIDKLSDNELELFFTSRYKDSLSTK